LNPQIKKLADKRDALRTSNRMLVDTAEKEDRDMTVEEAEQFECSRVEIEGLETRITRLQDVLTEAAKDAKPTDGLKLEPPSQTRIEAKTPAWVDDPRKGFKTHTDFLMEVMKAPQRGEVADARMQYLSGSRTRFLTAAGSDEQGTYADPYGGFLVPIGFSPQLLMVPADAQDAGIATTRVPMTTPTVTFNARVDKSHATSVSGGLTVCRRAETQSQTASRMQFEQVTIKADSLYGLAYATEELLQDSPQSFVAMLEKGFSDQFLWHLVGERLEGSGVGEYMGVLGSPCIVSIGKETGQAADTIVYNNVIKMRARCWNFGRAVWHYNQDCLPTLMQMTIPIGTSGIPAWQTSAREGEPDMFLGRPAYACEHCATVGDTGDILLAVWSEYLEGIYQAMGMAESIHVRFIENERAFRFTMRCGGAPWWRSALTPKKSAASLSPFVKLDAR
jgi:HK97 family phage major capsid protein